MRPRLPSGGAVAILAAVALVLLALPAHAPAQSPRPPAGAEAGVLGLGARGPVVRELQRELRRRGIRVVVDGRYGPGTKRAVARLQRRLGLRVNGIVDRSFLWSMGLSVCGLPGPTTARGGPRNELRLGATGPRVCALQRLLVRAGDDDVEVDGGYGPLTRAAVRRAQRRVGLRPSGVADDLLLRRLRAPRPGAPTPVRAGTLLSVGAQGDAVLRLQSELRRRGYEVSADGVFGPQTRRAVVRVQRSLGVAVDGRVDAALLRRLGTFRARHLRVFPVQAPHSFGDDWGAPRHQGRHQGNDIVAPRRAPVVAVADGVIDRMTRVERGLGGIYVWLRDDAGTRYYYAHLSSIAPGLAPGSRVRAGQRIGAVGRTGDARGGVFHLHFELHPAGRGAVNPYPELRAVDTVTVAI
ncbi:peptidoglycan-binding protein [Miltoncostaea oceani]|uniref:peptidoglycan-binding protein n=1 Tax=Miltoncostaea oceani TaxID=2843216 RepID=UPI001C3C2E6F|nr:peptidoglycan-binding protein [Miltoncostaea oceani]